MNTLTKLALGALGRLHPRPAAVPTAHTLVLPEPRRAGGAALLDALQRRESRREFDAAPLDDQLLSTLLWACCGVNRPLLGGRTAPSAMNAQEVQVHVAMAEGLFRYEPVAHVLQLCVALDVRRVTGYQDFVDTAPLDLIYVADHARAHRVTAAQRSAYAYAAAGAMAQNVYLCCAALGLATVIRAWFNHQALSDAMGLGSEQQLLLCQTVGRQPVGA